MQNIGKDITGMGGFAPFTYNGSAGLVMPGYPRNTTMCFSMRQRTAAGTQGCVSQLASNWSCTLIK